MRMLARRVKYRRYPGTTSTRISDTSPAHRLPVTATPCHGQEQPSGDTYLGAHVLQSVETSLKLLPLADGEHAAVPIWIRHSQAAYCHASTGGIPAFIRLLRGHAQMSRLLSVVLVFLVLSAMAAAAEHPCDVLDKQTAERLVGTLVRDQGNARSAGQRMPDYTEIACLYRSVNWNPPRGHVVLSDSEYPSTQAATASFQQSRQRAIDVQGDVAVKDRRGLGDAATVVKSTHEVLVQIVKGRKIVVARLSRQDGIHDLSVPDRAADLLLEVAAQAVRDLGPHPTTVRPMAQMPPRPPPPPVDPRTGLRPPTIGW